jgi:hypothetical protein
MQRYANLPGRPILKPVGGHFRIILASVYMVMVMLCVSALSSGTSLIILESEGAPADVQQSVAVKNGQVVELKDVYRLLEGTGICETQLIHHRRETKNTAYEFENTQPMVFYAKDGGVRSSHPNGGWGWGGGGGQHVVLGLRVLRTMFAHFESLALRFDRGRWGTKSPPGKPIATILWALPPN